MLNFVFEDIEDNNNFINCKDINTSGIGRFGKSALLNATHLFYSFNNKPLGINYYDLNQDLSSYVISSGVNHSPDDWTGHNPRVKSLFSYLNEKYVKDLRNGKAFLLLDQSLEGYQTSWLWDFFHRECVEFQISPTQIIYVTGNMIVEDVYKEWADGNGIQERIKVIGYPHFEFDMGRSAYERSKTSNPLPTIQKHLEYKLENRDNIKTYACLNKRLRFHRIWFYTYLYESGLLNNGLVSMNKFDKGGYFFEGEVLEEEKLIPMIDKLPLLVYGKRNNELDDNYYINRFNDDICLDTYVTVISEAHCGDSDKTMFLSEKTFKVIACRHPFMIMGNKDSMKKMREIGYKTFGDLIDEGYDTLPTHERLKYIIESIRKIDNVKDKYEWFCGLLDTIEYNYNTLISKLYRLPDAFVEVEDYINKTNTKRFF